MSGFLELCFEEVDGFEILAGKCQIVGIVERGISDGEFCAIGLSVCPRVAVRSGPGAAQSGPSAKPHIVAYRVAIVKGNIREGLSRPTCHGRSARA